MKKTLLIGMLAAFAISALSIQDLSAQNPVKKAKMDQKEVKAAKQKTDKPAVSKDGPTNPVRTSTPDRRPQPSSSSENATQTPNNGKEPRFTTSKPQCGEQPNSMVQPKPKVKDPVPSPTQQQGDR